jgi:hypothetical protein
MSFFTAVSITASFGHDSSPILPKHIKCFGDELTLSNCSFTDNYNPNKCRQIAGVICEGLFDSGVIGLLTLNGIHHCFTAPCHSNGITDCNECNNAADCQPLHNAECNCTSECYNNGMCCSDVGYLQNCFGRAQMKIFYPHMYVYICDNVWFISYR